MKVVRREAAARGFAGNCCSCNWFLRSRPIHSCSTLRQHLLWKHFIFICFTAHLQLIKRRSEQTWLIVLNSIRSGGVMTSSRFWVSLPKFNCNIRTSISAKPKKYQFNMFHWKGKYYKQCRWSWCCCKTKRVWEDFQFFGLSRLTPDEFTWLWKDWLK